MTPILAALNPISVMNSFSTGTYAARVDAVVSTYKWHWRERGATFDDTLMRRMALPTGHGRYRGMLHHLGKDHTTATIGIRRHRGTCQDF
jgi:hypothetical protein